MDGKTRNERKGKDAPASQDAIDSWRDVTSSKVDLEKAPAPSPAGSTAAEASSEVAVSRVRGLRVMVVGEDARRIEDIAEALHRLRVRIAVGSPDESGYRTGLSFRPDVVVAELTRPGEPGWWLFQRFRRHPLLRWVPVLLMKWWEDGPKGGVNVGRVVERIADTLAPIRILEERIHAGRPLADRMDTTSPLVLVKAFVSTRTTGTLTVNDSWNVFEARFEAGSVLSVSRRGVDGATNEGEAAFFQLLMCDSGRWSFRAHEAGRGSRNIRVSVDELLDGAWRLGAGLVGPDAGGHDRGRFGLTLRLELFGDIASTLPEPARRLVEGLAAGIPSEDLRAIVSADADRPGIERALCALLRSGAVLLGPPSRRPSPGSQEERSERELRYLLSWIGEDHGSPGAVSDDPSLPAAPPPVAASGYYKVSRPMEEEIRLGRADRLMAPGAIRPSMEAPRQPSTTEISEPAGALAAAGAAERRPDGPFGDGPARVDSRAGKVLPHDSLVPEPGQEILRSRRQMWVAILLAIVLGGLLVAGLVVIGAGGRETPEKVDSR